MPQIEVNGAKLWYEACGEGAETIVFSHGLLWSGRMFEKQIAFFRDRYRCIAYDHRGQGQSELTRGGYDMDTLSVDAEQLVEKLGAGPCHFVGLSMGGFVGMRLAIRRPDLVRSLALLNTAADPEPRKNWLKYVPLLAIARTVGLAPVVPPVMKIMFGRAFLADDSRRAELEEMERRLVANSKIGATRATLGVITRDAVQGLDRLCVPTVVIEGADDRAIAAARSKATAARIAGAKLVTIPRAGHTSTVEEPEAVSRALAEFWASSTKSAA